MSGVSRGWRAPIVLAALLAACGGPRSRTASPQLDAGADAGTPLAPPDAGPVTNDAGTHEDAGVDAGPGPTGDAGADAGPILDAGSESGADAGLDGGPDGGSAASSDGGCGYLNEGTPLHVAAGIDVCLPPVVCDPETCPPQLGRCVNGACVFNAGYSGIATFPEAWSTYYCALSTGGCHGVTQLEFPEITAQQIAAARGLVLCDQADAGSTAECVGISAAPPMIVGNSQEALNPANQAPVTDWGLGLTEASGLCYELTGPGGTVLVALTDRCGGYCKCNGSGLQECGPCVNASSLEVGCSCVGTVPGVYSQCCGDGCPSLNPECDWCASNNHPHFDLDTGTFNRLCASQAGQGSCQLTGVKYVSCLTPQGWPPGSSVIDGGTSGGTCGASAFDCSGVSPGSNQELIPGSGCCCDWNDCPSTGNSCTAAPASCPAQSCACGAGQPDSDHPQVSPGCCCLSGLTATDGGTCQ